MLKITNRQRSPIQLVVRSFSKKTPRSFTTKTIPGIGSGHNVIEIEDERYTEYFDRLERWELISVERINK